ncbi:uncharacterized protein B0H64DRAFT_433683 [Chaetomium fimeti]|uniref:phosphatidylinositol-3,4,5-trisphosphate 3-phosphatase n=1 Tax=Chaetomium fimeti TaxID=1854472 RepID=A0AAE0LRG0_9PEZI|nr:hypothetical protein B0H64DRAFT_433683 [Chaetomium fimeti]
MASLLRQLVAGPRAQHQETGLDLCYVTENIIATSGPSQTYPQRAYRTPLDRLVAFLDARHGSRWAVWEFRAEGTGYPDAAVHGRVRHFPWPDHHPPPFGLVPRIVGGMRSGKDGEAGGEGGNEKGTKDEKGDRVIVVHCKAGKGRSGTMACSYLIAECGWTPEDALARFTERRMRPGFGAGVSIPSQLRWISYVDRWTRGGKKYLDRPVEIAEIHVWGLRNGVKVEVEGFVEEGKKIRVFHTFKQEERIVVEPGAPGGGGVVDMVQDMAGYGASATVGETGEAEEDADYGEIVKGDNGKDNSKSETPSRSSSKSPSQKLKESRTAGLMRKLSRRKPDSSADLNKLDKVGPRSKTIAMPDASQVSSTGTPPPGKGGSPSRSTTSLQNGFSFADSSEPGGQAVIFKPSGSIRVPNSDINISVERRNRAPASVGLTMVTAVAHVWFNAFFEGNGPEQDGKADDSGVFEIDWDKMDGIKGSSRRGTRALDRLAVVWRVAGTGVAGAEEVTSGVAINEPGEDSPVPQMQAADWKGGNQEDPTADKHLGLRVEDPESREVSKASSVKSQEVGDTGGGAPKGEKDGDGDDRASLEGVKVSGPTGEDVLDVDEAPAGNGQGSSGQSEIKGRDPAIL